MIDPAYQRLKTASWPQGVIGGEQMTGVRTTPESIEIPATVHNRSDLLKPAANGISRSSRRLQQDIRRVLAFGQNLVQALYDQRHPLDEALASMTARVHHQPIDPKLSAQRRSSSFKASMDRRRVSTSSLARLIR